MTFQQVSEMTLHETAIAVNAISKRKKATFRLYASCLGVTFKDDDNDYSSHEVEFNDRQEQAMKKAMAEQIAKKGLKHV